MINKTIFMKIKIPKILFICLCSLISFSVTAQDGGDERTGQAGASELLINP